MTQFLLDGLGDRLAAARKVNGLSAQALADKCGPSVIRAVIANVESGRRNTLELAQLLDIAWALQTPPMALVFPLDDLDNIVAIDGDREVTLSEALPWAQGRLLGEELSPAGRDATTRIELILLYLTAQADLWATEELVRAADRASLTEEAWTRLQSRAAGARNHFDASRSVLRGMDVRF